tara:strand:- start:556 stop:1134 length:579 start_codon:yes stop_codon:yes gene_type:complete
MTFHSDLFKDIEKHMNGRGHLSNPAQIVGSDYMVYRSKAEKQVGEHLSKVRGLTYGANTVYRSRGDDGRVRKIELDFHIIYKGQQLIVEIDGPHHLEGVIQAEARLNPFRDSLIEVRRYPVSDEPNWAENVSRSIVDHMELRHNQNPYLSDLIKHFDEKSLETLNLLENKITELSDKLYQEIHSKELDKAPF